MRATTSGPTLLLDLRTELREPQPGPRPEPPEPPSPPSPVPEPPPQPDPPPIPTAELLRLRPRGIEEPGARRPPSDE